jgi:hypothetical protein
MIAQSRKVRKEKQMPWKRKAIHHFGGTGINLGLPVFPLELPLIF